MSSSTKSNLYAYAREHGITEEQLMVKEYITKNAGESNDMFKGIYEKLDSEIDKHEQTILELTNALNEARKVELPYLQLANEIAAAYPAIKHVYMGQGAQIALDTIDVKPAVYMKVQTDTLMSEASLSWVNLSVKHTVS